MRFLSKVIFICNICFIISVVMRYVEMKKISAAGSSSVLGFQPLQSTLIILGYGAVIFNFIFLLTCLFVFIFKKTMEVSIGLLLFNLVLFVIQLIYFLY